MFTYTFVQTHTVQHGVNLSVNHGLRVIMCQGWLINYNKCTVMRDADNGGGYACVWEQKVCGNSLYLPFKFTVNLKLL